MIRKLFSILLCAFALLLLMGAALAPGQSVTILAEEEGAAVVSSLALTTTPRVELSGQAVPAAAATSPLKVAESTDSGLFIDGVNAPAGIYRTQDNGVTYVSLAGMAMALDSTAEVQWEEASRNVVLTTAALRLSAKVGQSYVVANGRYFYVPEQVQLVEGRVTVPLWVVAKALDAQVGWDEASGTIHVARGSGAVLPGEAFYNADSLFWLSRIITAESGNQPLDGQIAVGNVVMNRVNSPRFPNSVKEVIAQKNQFTPYRGGKLAERTPNASSIIAAKLTLDGAVVSQTEGALYFDSANNSWAARNKECVAVIGNHSFYR